MFSRNDDAVGVTNGYLLEVESPKETFYFTFHYKALFGQLHLTKPTRRSNPNDDAMVFRNSYQFNAEAFNHLREAFNAKHSSPQAFNAKHSTPQAFNVQHSTPQAFNAKHSTPQAFNAKHSTPQAFNAKHSTTFNGHLQYLPPFLPIPFIPKIFHE